MINQWEHTYRRFSLPDDPVPAEFKCMACDGEPHFEVLPEYRCEQCGSTGDVRIDRDFEGVTCASLD